MNRRIRAITVVVGVVLFGGLVSCCANSSSESERPDPAQMVDGGSWYVRERWPHDGNPYETEHLVVYSDGASQQARQRLGGLAEEVWVEVIDEMGLVPATMFKFPAGQDKVDLYANRYNVVEGGGARAYHAGVIIASFDNDIGESTNVSVVRIVLKHELVHVAEQLLMGRWTGNVAVSDPRRMPTWFSEGTGEALSGGTTGGAPRTLDQIEGLIADYGQINPIAWRVDLPPSKVFSSDAYPRYYYPMAQLAVEYLLDPVGLGKSPEDLAAVMLDMGNDVSFAEAFENQIGISQSDYETQFFARMDTYLPQSEFPVEAVTLGLVCLLAAGVMGGSLVWGQRHWPAGASGSLQSEVPVWTRRARRGFVVEIWAFGFITVGFLALALFSIEFDVLPAGTDLALLYAVAAGFFASSVAILMWAIRRGSDRSRRAFLIPPLVIVAAVITNAVIDQITF
ncbi:MAG: hypothetical protein GY720_22125 [bacterium]|nr:hypothetical protein [bacterium]